MLADGAISGLLLLVTDDYHYHYIQYFQFRFNLNTNTVMYTVTHKALE